MSDTLSLKSDQYDVIVNVKIKNLSFNEEKLAWEFLNYTNKDYTVDESDILYIKMGDVHHLGIRAFDTNTRREVYERQGGKCAICGKYFEIEQMEADHITPWVEGGRTIAANCQMLCRDCNRRKSAK